MRPTQLLDTQMQHDGNPVHRRRFDALLDMIDAAISGKVISVTALGRALAGDAKEKHRIKRADLLIGNDALFCERNIYYQKMTSWLCANTPHPVIQVDWSTLTADEHWHLLRASVSFHGRALTLFEMVFEQKDYGTAQSHKRFLRQLKSLLPVTCSPILVTDAGFKNPWFRAVSAMGWDWVGRVRGKVQIARNQEDRWIPATLLQYVIEQNKPTDLGTFLLAKTSPLSCRIVSLKKPPQGRKDRNKRGDVARKSKSRDHAQSEREGWVLATSLSELAPVQITNIYKQRMQIEQGFRDTKSPRFGLGMDYSGSRSLHRLSNLLLIASLALYSLLLIGLTAEKNELHPQFQANTIRRRRVLSFVYLALRVIKRLPDFLVTSDDVLEAQRDIREYQAALITT
ncbi:MAG: IS4 family transposase [Gammaproteobacteria bacterium]|nr:IS4 family transposase [Gammaproteobacteria bacterium]